MAGTTRQSGKKGYRSCELNNYKVEVVDFDGATEEFNVEARIRHAGKLHEHL